MQGSRIYHTLNDPAHKPPQEVDFDDGMFLPTSFIGGNGQVNPVIAAKGYFKAVESILAPLCNCKSWRLDTSNDMCIRIGIARGAHLDLALYAIPDDEFTQLMKSAAHDQSIDSEGVDDYEPKLSEAVYRELRNDQIMLAKRERGWVPSDPRQLEDWFNSAVNDHGPIIRRVSRYFKGWRDYQWESGGPSSIALMASIVTVFDKQSGSISEDRDDLAVLAVASRLPTLFSNPIRNPVLPDMYLDESWSDLERQQYVSAAVALKEAMNVVTNGTYHKRIALSHLEDAFGQRIPSDERLIQLVSKEETVLSHEPTKVRAPTVPRTTSG